MDRLKTFLKYVLWVVAFYIFAMLLTYIGLNATYKNMDFSGTLPEEVNIILAQSTKVNGRIYGEITSSEENNLEGKYIKVQIFNRKDALTGTKYLKIENTEVNVPKKFQVMFTAENVKYYTVEILEDTEETRQKAIQAKSIFEEVFTNEELKGTSILALILGLTFLV